MKVFALMIVVLFMVAAYVAFKAQKNLADVTPRDVASAMPSVQVVDGGIIIKR